MNKKKCHLVLGSGGARGMAHIGVIEELEEMEIDILSVSGSSIGSMIGGIYASGSLADFKRWIIELDYYDYFRLVDFTFSGKGFIKGEKLFKELRQFIPEKQIEELPVRFNAVATNLKNGTEHVFSKGPILEAIRASSSLPTVLTPLVLDGLVLLDGGIVNPLPLNLVKKDPNAFICAVNLNARNKYTPSEENKSKKNTGKNILSFNERINKFFRSNKEVEEELGFFKLLNDSYDLTQDTLTQILLEKHKPDLLIEIPRTSCGTMEFIKAAELIDYGKKAFKKVIRNTK